MILKLKQTPAIYLVGFMGSGKSTIGRALADELGWCFVDLDEDVERLAGTTIAEIFDSQGEPAFRALETAVLKKRIQSVKAGRPHVIALGGGAFTIPENVDLTEKNGITIWLDTPLEVIERRIAAERAHRPLARDTTRFRELYEARRASYERADYRIETGDEPTASVVGRILAIPLFVSDTNSG